MAPLGDQTSLLTTAVKADSEITLMPKAADATGTGGDLPLGLPASSPTLLRHVDANNSHRSPVGGLEEEWRIVSSLKAQRTSNPVRNIVDNLRPPKDSTGTKPTINLSLGDPTTFGNLPCPEEIVKAIAENAASRRYNGYLPSVGSEEARRAVATAFSLPNAQLTTEDVVICSGGSGALEIAISALLNEGDNLLTPRPGFALYQVIAQSLGGHVKQYALDPCDSWSVDLGHLESLIDDRTRAILLNNPSNPCGNVLSEENLRGVLAIAQRHRLPIISDEIYARMTFSGHPFHPVASLTDTVPVLTIGGLAKQFGVPGYRVGWILFYDRHNILSSGDVSVRQGIRNLTQIIVGANSLIQSVIPRLFPPPHTPESASLDRFYAHYVGTLEANASFLSTRCQHIPGLSVVVPQGAMYVMLRLLPHAFPSFPLTIGDIGEGEVDDVAFAQALLAQENVVLLPGHVFGIRSFVRLVVCAPMPVLQDAMDRLEAFCTRHYAPPAHQEEKTQQHHHAALPMPMPAIKP